MKKNRSENVQNKEEAQSATSPVKKRRRKSKGRLIAIIALACVVICGGAFLIKTLFFKFVNPNVVESGFHTVVYKLPIDGSKPDEHSALENIGYMNARFLAQTEYYSEMSGTVDTILTQHVSTWKQYRDGALVQTDITRSSLINSARQFCYVGDRVLWRDAAGGSSSYNGLDTAWKTGEPTGNITVEDFKATRGLPGTEFAVYVINEETLLGADDVIDHGDGTFSQTFYLNPATDKAPAYYVNQMMTTGGLTDLPVFEYITVTYTFDATWQVLSSDIDESYTATKGFTVGCHATYHTVYEYGTDKSVSDAYSSYFSEYASKPTTEGGVVEKVTAASCLSAAFAPVMTDPVTFNLNLSLDGSPVGGCIYVDVSDPSAMVVRAQIGEVFFAYEEDELWLRLGKNFRGKLDFSQLQSLLSSFTGKRVTFAEEEGFDLDQLLEQLGGGEFTLSEDGSTATLQSVLSFGNLELPIEFTFHISADKKDISLGGISTQFFASEHLLAADLCYAEQEMTPEIGDPATYLDLTGMVVKLVDIATGEAMDVNVCYTLSTDVGEFVLSGDICLDFASLCAKGELVIGYAGEEKRVSFAYCNDEVLSTVYLNVDGMKVRVAVDEAMDFISQFVEFPEFSEEDMDVSGLLETFLQLDLASMVSTDESGIRIATGKLLEAFGVTFDPGTLMISETESGISVSVSGIYAELESAQGFAIDESEYGEYTDLMPWVERVYELATSEAFKVAIEYAGEEFEVSGTVFLDISTLSVQGSVEITYAEGEKSVSFAYANGTQTIYASVDGIQVKASAQELVGFIERITGSSAQLPSMEVEEVLSKLFTIELGEVIELHGEEMQVDLEALLSLFGMEVSLGDANVAPTESGISVSVSGIYAELESAQSFAIDESEFSEYTDLMPWVERVYELATSEAFKVAIEYAGEEFQISGTVFLDIPTLSVQGSVEITYTEGEKNVSFAYTNGTQTIYASVDGIQVKASAQKLVAFIERITGSSAQLPSVEVEEVLSKLFTIELGEVIELHGGEMQVDLEALLSLFGMEVSLGDANVALTESGISVSVSGICAELESAQGFEVDESEYGEYTDLMPWAERVYELATSEAFKVDVQYAGEEFGVSGTVFLDIPTLSVQGSVEITYAEGEKSVSFAYANGTQTIYASVDGIQVKASAQELIAFIERITGSSAQLPSVEVEEVLSKLFTIELGEVIELHGGEMQVDLEALLSLFGMEVNIGEAGVALTESGISVSVSGIYAELESAQGFAIDESEFSEYTDLMPWAERIYELATSKAFKVAIAYTGKGFQIYGTVFLDVSTLSVQGSVEITYAEGEKNVSFAYANGTQNIYVSVDGIQVKANAQELIAFIERVTGSSAQLPSIELEEVLSKLFTIELGKVIVLHGEEMQVDLEALLGLFGMEVTVGNADASLTERGIAVSVSGIYAQIESTRSFAINDSESSEYTDLMPWVERVYELATSEAFKVDVQYAGEEFGVSGTVFLDISTLSVQGSVEITYAEGEKNVNFAYANGTQNIYASVDGIQVKASAQELVAFIERITGSNAQLPSVEVEEVLSKLFTIELGEVTELHGEEMQVDLEALLSLFGMEVSLGDANVALTERGIAVSVSGIYAELESAQGFAIDESEFSEYTDLMPWVERVYELATSEAFKVDVQYAGEEFGVSGTVFLDVSTLSVQGSVEITYAEGEKNVSFAYVNGTQTIYASVDGIRVKASAQELVAFIERITGSSAQLPSVEVEEVLSKLFTIELGEVIELHGGEMQVDLEALLSLFGMEVSLGDANVALTESGISVSVSGIYAELESVQSFRVDESGFSGYTDVAPVLDMVAGIYEAKQMAIVGEMTLSYGDLTLNVSIENGWISFENGFALRADLVVTMEDTVLTVKVDANVNDIRLVFGTLGVEVNYDGLTELQRALEETYARIAELVNRSSTNELLPQQLETLMQQLGAGVAVSELFSSFNAQDILRDLQLGGATEREGSLATISYENLSFDVCMSGNGVAVYLAPVRIDDVTLEGVSLSVCVPEGVPVWEERDYLTVSDLCELIDFIGAAVGTVASQDVSITFRDGITVSTEDGSAKFHINGQLVYHSGLLDKGFPILLDRDNKVLTVDPNAYLYVKLLLDEVSADDSDTDLNFEFWMLDSNGDGELEFFVSLSKFLPGSTQTSSPLTFSVSASDILTLLSGGLSLAGTQEGGVLREFLVGMGIPEETAEALFAVLDDYLVGKWLSADEKGQLSAVGGMLMQTLGVDRMLRDFLEGVSDSIEGAVDGFSPTTDINSYLHSLGLTYSEDGSVAFTLSFNSDVIYGGEGKQPLTIAFTKADVEGESYLTAISLANIYGNGNRENTSVSFAFDYAALTLNGDNTGVTVLKGEEQCASLVFADYANYTFAGVDELLKVLALSATHQLSDGSYALDRTFYISGDASLALGTLYTVNAITIDLAVFLDENGEVSLNAKLCYPGVQELNQVVINGDTQLDLTIKNGMVYMKRTQFTYWKTTFLWTTEETYDTPVVTYRVMPLTSFFSDIVGQLGYLLNLSDMILGLFPTDSGTTETVVEDYGVILSNYLKSYGYTAATVSAGAQWTLVMNGDYLTDATLGDIYIGLGAESYQGKDSVLRRLNLSTKLVSFLDLTADLAFRNPFDVWEEGYSDVTGDVTAELVDISEQLETFDWAAQSENYYIVPENRTVGYYLNGTCLAEQTVWYDAGGSGVVFNELNYPDISDYALEGYTLEWLQETGGRVEAVYNPNLYSVTLRAPVSLGEDWIFDGDGYVLTTQMYYGEAVSVFWGENSETFIVGIENNVFDLGEAVGDDVVLWEEAQIDLLANGTTVRIPLMPDTVVYTSNGVAFTLGEAVDVTSAEAKFDVAYTLAVPQAAGYTFLGWFVPDGEGVKSVSSVSYAGGGNTTVVSALWVRDLFVSATASDVRDGWLRKYSASASISGGMLAGALDNSSGGVTVKTTYNMHLTGWALNKTYNKTHDGYVSSDSCSFSKQVAGGRRFEITVTLTYSYSYTAQDGTLQSAVLSSVSKYVEQGW